jgi:hypothetical protein
MRTVIYAIFHAQRVAANAVRSLKTASGPADHVRLAVYRGEIGSEDLPVARTAARRRFLQAAVGGLVLGVLFGIVLLALGVATGEESLTVLFCGLAGMVVGCLGGTLSGAASPDPVLERLGHDVEKDGVILMLEANTRDELDRAATVMREHGARLVHA